MIRSRGSRRRAWWSGDGSPSPCSTPFWTPSPPPRSPFPSSTRRRSSPFRLAPTIQIDPVWQQRLLQSVEEAERLDQLDMVFRAALERGREA